MHPITSSNNPTFIDVYEDENCIHLGSGANSNTIETIILRYWGYPIDDEGNPKIPEEYIPAIMFYVKYMDAVSKGRPISTVALLQNEWRTQKMKQKGNNKMPDTIEAREIIDDWLSLISKSRETKYSIY